MVCFALSYDGAQQTQHPSMCMTTCKSGINGDTDGEADDLDADDHAWVFDDGGGCDDETDMNGDPYWVSFLAGAGSRKLKSHGAYEATAATTSTNKFMMSTAMDQVNYMCHLASLRGMMIPEAANVSAAEAFLNAYVVSLFLTWWS